MAFVRLRPRMFSESTYKRAVTVSVPSRPEGGAMAHKTEQHTPEPAVVDDEADVVSLLGSLDVEDTEDGESSDEA